MNTISPSRKAIAAGKNDNPLAGQFDIWGNHDRKLTAKPAISTFAADDAGPYGYPLHMQRVTAVSARAAMAAYRSENKKAAA
jgi:hypothetical protein